MPLLVSPMNSLNPTIVENRAAHPETVTVIELPRKKGASSRLPAIQILRGIAAALVVFHHSSGVVAMHNAHSSWIINSRLHIIGAAGVDIFFVISGFIMCYTTLEKGGAKDAAAFLRKRTLRIYPLYWFWTSVLLSIALSKLVRFSHSHEASFFISSYLLIPAFNGFDFHPFLDQGWTLSFEMLFYIVFSVGLWLNCRQSILTFLSASFVGLFVLSQFLPAGSGSKYLLSNTLIVEFLFGVVLAKLFLRTRAKPPRELIQNWAPIALTTLGSALLLSTALIHRTDAAFLIAGPWRFAFWGIPSALIVFGFATWNQKLTHPGLVYLGDASYSTYLCHIFFLGAFRLALERSSVMRNLPIDAEIVVLTVFTVLFTLPAYQWIELPLTSLLSLTSASRRVRLCP
jgi:peptidoglycan/LPS O-acetylase OafA/YrhL